MEHEEERGTKPLFELAPKNMTVTERLSRLEATMNKVLNRLEYLDHHFEHHFLTLQVRTVNAYFTVYSMRSRLLTTLVLCWGWQDHVDAVKNKLDGKEHEAEDRIKALEVTR